MIYFGWIVSKPEMLWRSTWLKRTFGRVEADAAAARAVQDQWRTAEAVERPRCVHAHALLTGRLKGALIIIWEPHTTSTETFTEATLHMLTADELFLHRRTGRRWAPQYGVFDIHQCSRSSDTRPVTRWHGCEQSQPRRQNLFWRCAHSD